MARSKSNQVNSPPQFFKRLDSIIAGVIIFAFVAAGFLASSWSPAGNLFLPVLGTGFLTDRTLHVQQQQSQIEEEAPRIQNAVLMPEELLLLVKSPVNHRFPPPEDLTCELGSNGGITTRVLGVEKLEPHRSGIRCGLKNDENNNIISSGSSFFKRAFVSLNGTGTGLVLANQVEFQAWNSLVFEAFITGSDVVLFVKGIVTRRGHQRRVGDLRCLFDNRVETRVLTAAQEVFRCDHPPRHLRPALTGKKVTLRVSGEPMPSVAEYHDSEPGLKPVAPGSKRYFICSCTMVFNIAKFLREWVVYHSRLGVERFFFYDNNSEDEIRAVLEELGGSFNVSRHFWPWLKSQEAGFSHCALRAREECTWMLYTDVDEFIFPRSWIRKNSKPLTAMVRGAGDPSSCKRRFWGPWGGGCKRVGQIFIGCRVFGPSGLTKHPEAGVTLGYTCRKRKLERHKSIVLLEAVDEPLLNVVHHFRLRPGYVNSSVASSRGVIYHFKYQVWDEFRAKFRRRVSAYVSDWKQERNLHSNDRAPGLGTEEVEPGDWSHRFCQVNDTELRSFVIQAFSSSRNRRGGRRMIWQ